MTSRLSTGRDRQWPGPGASPSLMRQRVAARLRCCGPLAAGPVQQYSTGSSVWPMPGATSSSGSICLRRCRSPIVGVIFRDGSNPLVMPSNCGRWSIAARAAGLRKGRSKLRDAQTLGDVLTELKSDRHTPLQGYDDHSTDAIMTIAWLRGAANNQAFGTRQGLRRSPAPKAGPSAWFDAWATPSPV